MRVSTTAFYTLAALIAGNLTQQAIAKPISPTAANSEAEDIESIPVFSPPTVGAVTPPEHLQDIDFAEAVLTQYSEEYSRELTEAAPVEFADRTGAVGFEMTAIAIAPESLGVEHSPLYLEYSDSSAEVGLIRDLENLEGSSLESLEASDLENSSVNQPADVLDVNDFSRYQSWSAVAPPEAVALPERRVESEWRVESEPKVIEAIATPEFFMPERSQWFNDMEASVNVLLPVAPSESAQSYALNALEEAEDLWIREVIEAEFASNPDTAWVEANAALTSDSVMAIAAT